MKDKIFFATVILSCVFVLGVHALAEDVKLREGVAAIAIGDDCQQVLVKDGLRVFNDFSGSNEDESQNSLSKELRFRIPADDEAVLTRALLAQLVYNREMADEDSVPTYDDFAALVGRIEDCIPKLDSVTSLTDVDYNHPNDIAIHYVIANGFMMPRNNNSFGAEVAVTARELMETVERQRPMKPANGKKYETLVESLKGILCFKTNSELAKLAVVNLYKKASCSLAHPLFPKKEKVAIRAMLDEIKKNARKMSAVTDVVGSKADQNTYIYKLDSGLHINELTIDSRKPETDPVEIVLFADTHFNAFNDKDEAEQNPSLMSTKQYRQWLANGASASCVNRLMEFARYSDQTVVAGDILDFLSWGAQQLTVEALFRKDVTLMACLGGHDVTRVMQGKVPDPTSLESRRKILADFWINDITYDSRVIKDKVMVVVMDNGMGQFYTSQIDKLKADIKRARANNWIILIAVHEPLCTRNPANKDTQPYMKGDPDIDTNFFDHKCCRPGHKEASDAVFDLIVNNADVVRGVFNGHEHSAYYTWFNGTYTDASGNRVEKSIPQHTVTCCIYRSGCLALITVK